MNSKLAFLTIGQAPRDDVLSEIIPLLSAKIKIEQAGALDNLEFEEIDRLKPEQNEFPLVSRLKNNAMAIVSRSKILPLLQEKIRELEKECDLIALLCTEDFSELRSKVPLIMPFNLLKEQVEILKPEKLLIFVPLEEQIEMARKKWQHQGTQVLISALNPYKLTPFLDPDAFFSKFITKTEEIDIIIFDCLGYPGHLLTLIASCRVKACLLPRVLLAHRINQMISNKDGT